MQKKIALIALFVASGLVSASAAALPGTLADKRPTSFPGGELPTVGGDATLPFDESFPPDAGHFPPTLPTLPDVEDKRPDLGDLIPGGDGFDVHFASNGEPYGPGEHPQGPYGPGNLPEPPHGPDNLPQHPAYGPDNLPDSAVGSPRSNPAWCPPGLEGHGCVPPGLQDQGGLPDVVFVESAGLEALTIIPEPTSLALLGIGGLALLRRR